MEIYRICSQCNKEFKVIKQGLAYGDIVTNFEDCPHCGTRNDIWIRIVNVR